MQSKKCKIEMAWILFLILGLQLVMPLQKTVYAGETPNSKSDVVAEISDAEDDNVVIEKGDKPYLALGADLSKEQRKTVLALMGIEPSALKKYDVTTITNQEEHEYLDSYLDKSTIGTRALSSVVIVKREEGSGISISTKNISYCTVGMYKNALATAGLQDADVIVAGPFPISGTAALIGAMKAYADMEGTSVDEENLDAAMNEIVVTGDLNESLPEGEQTEEFMAYVKQKIVEKKLTDPDEIQEVVKDAAGKFDINLTQEQINNVTGLMKKIGSLDLDPQKLIAQASSVYENVSNLVGDNKEGILGFLQKLFQKIMQIIKGLMSSKS